MSSKQLTLALLMRELKTADRRVKLAESGNEQRLIQVGRGRYRDATEEDREAQRTKIKQLKSE